MKKGFTLIELIVVIAIIGVLAATLLPTILGYVRKAKRTAANEGARVFYQYLQGGEKMMELNIPGTTDPVSLSELSGIAGDKGDYIDVQEFVTTTEIFGKNPDESQIKGYLDAFFVDGTLKAVAWSKDSSGGSVVGVYPSHYLPEDEPTWSNWDDKLKAEYN